MRSCVSNRMRYRAPFTVFPREMPSGLIIYYYQTYDSEGKRTTARTTGMTSKTAARAYCEQLRHSGELVPLKRKASDLSAYSEDFWVYEKCRYVRSKLARGQRIGKQHCKDNRSLLIRYILPTFGKSRLGYRITKNDIDNWLLSLPESGISNETANKAFKCLKIILTEAQKSG